MVKNRLLFKKNEKIEVLKSKVHRAVITEANLHYVGSLTLDEDLMDAARTSEHPYNAGLMFEALVARAQTALRAKD